jgi:hypothetical protein
VTKSKTVFTSWRCFFTEKVSLYPEEQTVANLKQTMEVKAKAKRSFTRQVFKGTDKRIVFCLSK